MTREPFAVGEWYHCFNRGVDKRRVFASGKDYKRFLTLLYLCNGKNNIRLAERYDSSFESVLRDLNVDRGEALVDLGIYVLMPNHVHLFCREKRKGGIAAFMQKVFTGYTMYFNKKYERTGALFAGTFKSRHVKNDRYFKQVVAYLLLNPAELFEPRWKTGHGDLARIKRQILQYPYSSLPDFVGQKRLQGSIITDLSRYYDRKPSLTQLLAEAQEYYSSQPPKV